MTNRSPTGSGSLENTPDQRFEGYGSPTDENHPRRQDRLDRRPDDFHHFRIKSACHDDRRPPLRRRCWCTRHQNRDNKTTGGCHLPARALSHRRSCSGSPFATWDYEDVAGSGFGYLSEFPHLVNGSMIDEIRGHADAYVECVSTTGLPQRLWQADEGIDGALLEGGYLWNRYYPSPQMHVQAADTLEPVCRRLLDPAGLADNADGR